jgi:hypothetical protein
MDLWVQVEVKDESEYTFFSGTASVYAPAFLPSALKRASTAQSGKYNQTYISLNVHISYHSPNRLFQPRIDPTIRITYHPLSRNLKVNRTGFACQTCSYTFEQPISVTSLKVFDQFPVFEDSTITVNLAAPPLVLLTVNKKGVFKVPEAVKISDATGAKVMRAGWS